MSFENAIDEAQKALELAGEDPAGPGGPIAMIASALVEIASGLRDEFAALHARLDEMDDGGGGDMG